MISKTNILINIVSVLFLSIMICLVVHSFLVVDSAEETIRKNNNVSEDSSVDIYFCKHTWKSDWFMIHYTIKIPDYVCSKRDKENFPWKCEEIHYEFDSGNIWFNVKTKEIHQI